MGFSLEQALHHTTGRRAKLCHFVSQRIENTRSDVSKNVESE
jgi:hypothetical protein